LQENEGTVEHSSNGEDRYVLILIRRVTMMSEI